ncbi:MAG: family 78 glycoside hydrolase catalytic domain [Oscillospiraceae bacterium]
MQNARWIWDGSNALEKNVWVCFRKEFEIDFPRWGSAVLQITADSRYTVYINGTAVGMGPVRNWPRQIVWDTYDVALLLHRGSNVIAVEVHHYGTSTSQYIHGEGGLWLTLSVHGQGQTLQIQSDKSFRCIQNPAFAKNTTRVNIAQPWAEVYDARLFEEGYKTQGYNEEGWQLPQELPEGHWKYSCMRPSGIEEMAARYAYPKTLMEKSRLSTPGQCLTLDFKPGFYPGDTTTEDRMQLGWFATVVHCAQPVKGRLQKIMKCSRVVVNGLEIPLPDRQFVPVSLQKGQNLILIDNAGVYQRLECALYLEFPAPLQFSNPVNPGAESPFLLAGPFEQVPIGNIVCQDGFEMDWQNPEYLAVGKCARPEEIKQFSRWLKPMRLQDVDMENNNYRLAFARYHKLPVLPADRNMAVANGSCTLVPVCGEDMLYLLDFGVQVGGLVEIEVQAEAGTRIDLLGFEYMYLDGRMDIPFDLNNAMSYIANGRRSVYRFHRRAGFRYLAVTVRKGHVAPAKLFRVQVLERGFGVDEPGTFRCSDDQLNKIWEISRTTLLKSLDDVFIDSCFEQALWIGDERCESLFQNYVFGADELHKRNCRMAALSLERSALPECHVPAGVSFVLTAWALLWMISCEECAVHSGDTEFAKEIYPYVKKAAEKFLGYVNQDGLLEIDAWNLFDWAPMDTPFKGIVAHQNAFLAAALCSTASLARLAGKAAQAPGFEHRAALLRQAVDRHFWNGEKQAYVDCIRRQGGQSQVVSLQTHSVLLLCGCVPESKKEIVFSYLVNRPPHFVDIGSPFAAFFYYEALAARGKYELFLKDIRKHWGTMVYHGDTTCWETLLGFDPHRPTRSHCHAWSASPCYLFGKYLLGANLQGAGCAAAVISPNPCGLAWAEGMVPTVRGYIKVRWEFVEQAFLVQISAPAGVEIKVEPPRGVQNPKIKIQQY